MRKLILIVFSSVFVYTLNAQTNSDTKVIEPDAIDLGLSVKWASFNLGASKPEEYGNYYAWGEVQTKQEYDWNNYKYGNNDVELTKYVTHEQYGKDGLTDNLKVLDSNDDAATFLLGAFWRMPTNNEFSELREKCSWTWTLENGVNGYRVKGPNNKTIFIPAAGMYISSNNNTLNKGGRYWTSEVFSQNNMANTLYFDSNTSHTGWDAKNRPYGLSIRPVYSDSTSKDPSGIDNIKVHSNIRIQSQNGTIKLSGLDGNEKVSFYSIDGKEIETDFSNSGTIVRTFSKNQIILIKVENTITKIAL